MTTYQLAMLIASVAGGLALFIFGMNVMTEGLRQAAGESLRGMIARATKSRFTGLAMGTILGILVQSSATTVMLVGFINAGLMTLVESIPPMLGANLGTSISMQLISFRLGDYCFFAIAIGLICNMASPNPKIKSIGRAIMGFGILFLGMNTMSGAIKPHRETFQALLKGIHGDTVGGLLAGAGMSTLFTGIIQSSGAMVGMCFALIDADVFTNLSQVYPIILGSRIGTCATALLGSIGTNINARRSAISHLLFNVLTTIIAIAFAPLIMRLAAMTTAPMPTDILDPNVAPILLRQTANVNTGLMLMGIVIFLPIAPLYAKLVTWLVRSKQKPPEPSYLNNELLSCPERALYATIQELQRAVRMCIASFHLTLEIIFTDSKKDIQTIRLNESVVDEVKLAVKAYINTLNLRILSSRQALLAQSLNRIMADIERIGDHVDELCDITIRRHKNPKARLSREALDMLRELYECADKTLLAVMASCNPELEGFRDEAKKIFDARDAYVVKSLAIKTAFANKVVSHEIASITGVYFSEYVSALDRIVRHAKAIALLEVQPHFYIKKKKLNRVINEAEEFTIPERVDPAEFLSSVHWEDPSNPPTVKPEPPAQ